MKEAGRFFSIMSMKKQWVVAGVIVGLILLGVGGGCGYSAWDTARRIFNNQYSITNLSAKTYKWCTNGLPFVSDLEKILNKKYVVLLQNNTELRPSGGFMGSYATVSTKCEGLSAKCGIKEIKVQDIYEPDGKLPGHVEPPYPVQEAFGQGWWKLRDANWDPDFASAAAIVAWFMEQGGEANIDGIFAVNQLTVNQLISIFGPIKLNTYDETITDKNFYRLAQRYAETRIEGNKTDKRGFLGAVGVALEERIKSAKLNQLIQLASLTVKELEKGEILVWMKDEKMQKEIEFRGWGGKLEAGWNQQSDFLYLVESNLGANKANCCVTRDVTHDLIHDGHMIKEKVTIKWKNESEFEHPKPPDFWGGNYIDYVRVIVPRESVIVTVTVGGKKIRKATLEDFELPNSLRQGRSEDMYNIEERGRLQIIGFWAVVKAGKELRVEMEFQSDRVTKSSSILVKHQPGMGEIGYELIVDGKIRGDERLDRDKEFIWTR